MRCSTELQRAALKTATKAALTALGGLDAAATVSPIARSQLSRAADRNTPDCFLRLDVALDLDLASEQPVMTQALAAAQGYALTPLIIGPGMTADALSTLAEGMANLLSAIVRALSDGQLTDDERAAVMARLADVRTRMDRAATPAAAA